MCQQKGLLTVRNIKSKTLSQSYSSSVKSGNKRKTRFSLRTLATTLSLVLLSMSCSNSYAQPESTINEPMEYGYYYKGKLITMTASKRLIAISTTGSAFKDFVNKQQLQRNPLSDRPELIKFNLSLYEVPAPKRKTDKRIDLHAQMKRFVTTTGEEVQPVFEQGQALLIPSNQVIVGFKSATILEEAQDYLAQYRETQGIVHIKSHRKKSFIITIDNPANGRVYLVSQFLAGLEDVRFAEPNHIVVHLDDPGLQSIFHFPKKHLNKKDGGVKHNSPVTWTNLLSEDCEGTTLPNGWSTDRLSNEHPDAYWNVTNLRSHSGSRSCYATGGGSEGVAAPGDYPSNVYSWLDTPILDLAEYEEVYIELWFYAKYYSTWEPIGGANLCAFGRVGIHDPVSDSTTFFCPDSLPCLNARVAGDLTRDPTTDGGWRRALLRIPPGLREDGVNVRFVFQGLSEGYCYGTAEGLYIDQIRIVGTTDVDTEPVSSDTYGARTYEFKNAGQIAGLGDDSKDMQLPEAWERVSVSPDVVVAVIDSGVDLTHPDLNLVTGYNADGSIGGGEYGIPHGTSVAGNVGAIGNNGLGVIGTAPGVSIMPVVLGGLTSDEADSIDVAVAHGADILSNSWGWVDSPSADIENAVNDALGEGKVVLFAVGNGPDRYPFSYDVAFPASLCGSTDVICVGASSPTDEHKAAASSDGQFWWGSSYIGDGPDVVAPGPWNYTTDIQGAAGYNDGSLIDPDDPTSADYTPIFGGTSSATPKVAGVAVLMLSASSDLTPHQVKMILRETADDIDEPGFDDKTGAGRVNAEQAVRFSSTIPAATCIPPATGVPFSPGPPVWWDSNIPGAEGIYNRIDDPRWKGAVRIGHGEGATEHVAFRALHHTDGGAQSVYMSWWIKLAPEADPTQNVVQVAFRPDIATMGLLLKAQLNATNAENTTDVDIELHPVASDGSLELALDPNPSWTNKIHVWANRPDEHTWALHINIPIDDDLGNGVILGTDFHMWYEILQGAPDDVVIEYTWPRDVRFAMDSTGHLPAPWMWPRFRLSTEWSDPECATGGITIEAVDIGTDHPEGAGYIGDRINEIYARPTNKTGTPIPVGKVHARFRLANWGTQPDPTDVADPGQLWQDIPGLEDVTQVPPPDEVENNDQWNISDTWHPGPEWFDGTHWDHQCMMVELSGPELKFLKSSVYRNMNFISTSKYSEDAQVSVVGLAPLSAASRDVYLYVERKNMPRRLENSQYRRSQMLTSDMVKEREFTVSEYDERPDVEKIADHMPTFVVHAYQDTGRTISINTATRRVLRPMTSYGYFAEHHGALTGWKYKLDGTNLVEIAPDFYKVTVPNSSNTIVTTHIEAVEHSWAFSALLGITSAHSSFNNVVDAGFSANLGIEHFLSSVVSLDGILGYHTFDNAGLGRDMNIRQLSLNARYYFPPLGVRPFTNAGIGVYDLEPGSSEFGTNIGVGLQYNLIPEWALEFAYNYHKVNAPSPEPRFSTLQVGVNHLF
jgi:opacity protein-like surface antigen